MGVVTDSKKNCRTVGPPQEKAPPCFTGLFVVSSTVLREKPEVPTAHDRGETRINASKGASS